jgi:hypothetical protein
LHENFSDKEDFGSFSFLSELLVILVNWELKQRAAFCRCADRCGVGEKNECGMDDQ